MKAILLHNILKRYGRQRHPRLESYETLKERGELVEWRFIPSQSTIIYVSHEWAGTNHPDPDGTQFYHLLHVLERLQRGNIAQVDMDAFHSIIYKHNLSTSSSEWKTTLNPERTYLWYDGFCVPKSKRDENFRSIPLYVQRSDFMIILAPGCTHADRINPQTKRRLHLSYRTYRLRARNVLEMFSAFLTTKGGENAKPALLVRSGSGTPNWISPLECQKLAVGMSTFDCCESNHETPFTHCQRSVFLKLLDEMIDSRSHSLFQSNNVSEASFTMCFKNYWCRGLCVDDSIVNENS